MFDNSIIIPHIHQGPARLVTNRQEVYEGNIWREFIVLSEGKLSFNLHNKAIYPSVCRPANEPSALGARLGLLGANRDRAAKSAARPNRAETEKGAGFRDRAEPSTTSPEPRPRNRDSRLARLVCRV